MLKKLYIVLIAASIGFLGCKKYPENTVWFKNPEKFFKGGVITAYTLNGIDHLQDIKDLYHNFPYNYYGSKIEDATQLPFTYNSGDKTISCDYGEGSFVFTKTKKNIEISFNPLNSIYGASDIFFGNNSWKILKLTKSGQLKIQTYANLKTVIIQFN